ncbi:MAG TPA: amidohydrolase family protein [Candidatus Saccharimonadales bacterium]|nr:amidohydrolase family protein [Candidatus Saccharimonadales bacterium]
MPEIEGTLTETGRSTRIALDGTRLAAVEEADIAPGSWIAPGFIDVQVNGYAGHDVNAAHPSADEVGAMVHALWTRGITGVCPTVCTASQADMVARIRAVADACDAEPLVARSVVGIHVEGPYISAEDGPRGAHPLEHVRPPSLAEYASWQEAARGRIRIITLSPEHQGAIGYIEAITADGVVASIGHTAATSEQIQAAVGAGARFSTHLGNGAHALIARHPNYIWDQLADDRLMAGFIFDGQHLPPAVMKTVVRAKGIERTILVSDAIEVAGLAPGVYSSSIGGRVELEASGRVNLVGTPYLAGSSASLVDCLGNAIQFAGLTISDAVRLVSANPARVLAVDGPGGRGTVRTGMGADLTVFRVSPDGQIIVERTVVGGQTVYAA